MNTWLLTALLLSTVTVTACTLAPLAPPQSGTLSGTLHIGPICPVERADIPCYPGQAAFDARPISITDVHGKTIARIVATAPSGNFTSTLATGEYTVTVQSASSIEHVQPQRVVINANETTDVGFSIDTGIR